MDDHVSLILGQFLALAALIGATIEYAELARRRAARRRRDEIAAEEAAGLRSLVRTFLTDGS